MNVPKRTFTPFGLLRLQNPQQRPPNGASSNEQPSEPARIVDVERQKYLTPNSLHSGGAEINRGLPIPFVKSGVISAFTFGDVKRVYIDTHANEGFSGGPVVFRPQQGRREPNELRVAGVVIGYIQHHRPLHDADGNHLVNVGENAGIVVAVEVQHVTDLIDANQIGFELPTGR